MNKHLIKRLTAFALITVMLLTVSPLSAFAQFSENMNMLRIQQREAQIEALFRERNDAEYELNRLLEEEEISEADYSLALELHGGQTTAFLSDTISAETLDLICEYSDAIDAAESALFALGVVKVAPDDQESKDFLFELFQRENTDDAPEYSPNNWVPDLKSQINRLIGLYNVFIYPQATMGLADPAGGGGFLYYDTAVIKVTHKEWGALGLLNRKSTDTILAERIATQEKWISFLTSTVTLGIEVGVSLSSLSGGWGYAVSGAFFIINSVFPMLNNPNYGPASSEEAHRFSQITSTAEMTFFYAKPLTKNPMNEWFHLGSYNYVHVAESQLISYFNGTYVRDMFVETYCAAHKGAANMSHFLSPFNSSIYDLRLFTPLGRNAGTLRYTGFDRAYLHVTKFYSSPLLIPTS